MSPRRIWLWAALIAIAVLAVLSIVGAFLGSDRAGEMFNSLPLAIFWAVLTALLVGGFVASGRMIRRPGLLAMHLGAVLVLAGGMWGSEAGHLLRAGLTGAEKPRKGYMVIWQGQTESRLYELNHPEELRSLEFEVKLEKFWVEYYPADEPPYLAVGIARGGIAAARQSHRIDWTIGRETPIPFTDARVRVLQFFPAARATKKAGVMHVVPDASGQPACKLELTQGERVVRGWLIADHRPGPAPLPLAKLYATAGKWRQAGAPTLFLVKTAAVRDFKSRLSIVRDGQVVAGKVIEVNHPLHYGGYHFYQLDYDKAAGRYTVLLVVSDAGLAVVYAGLVLICAGAVWRFWVGPAWRYFKVARRKREAAS